MTSIRHSAAERRDDVLDAALIEFADRGFEGTSTEDIAKRAGISQPYLFRLFGTKKDLYIASVGRCYRDTLELFQRAAEGLRGEESIATLCRKEGLAPNLYYRWSKEFLEAGKKRLVGDTSREATSTEVMDLRKENLGLKQLVAETVLENRLLKKSVTASASDKDERCD